MTTTPRTPHAPTVSKLLNRQPEFFRSPHIGTSGFIVEKVAPRVEYMHGGPTTLLWTEAYNPRTDKRTFEERSAVERKMKAQMRAFLEGIGFAVFTAPGGHLVLLTPEGAAATTTASVRADELFGATLRVLAVKTTDLAEERSTEVRHIPRNQAHAELVLALRYNADGVSEENGNAVVGDRFSRTEYLRLGAENVGDGPYELRARLGDGAPISRHTTRESAQEAGRGYAEGLATWAGAPESWQWKLRDESRWAGQDVCEWELVGEESTGFVVRGPRTDPPRTRPEVRDVPHRLLVGGEERHPALSPGRIRTNVRNAWHSGTDMEQEPDGTVRIGQWRYEPLRVREVTPEPAGRITLPLEPFAPLYSLYRGKRWEEHEFGRIVCMRLRCLTDTAGARVWAEETPSPSFYTLSPDVGDLIVYRPEQESETAQASEAVRAGTHLVRDTGLVADGINVYHCPECGNSGGLTSFIKRPCTEEMQKERAAEYATSMQRVYLEAARTLLGMARIDVVPDGGEGSGVRLYPAPGARAVRLVTVLGGQDHERMPSEQWTEASSAQRAEWMRYWGGARMTLQGGGWRQATGDDPVLFEAPDGIEGECAHPVRFAGHRLPTTPEAVEVLVRGGLKSVQGFRCVDCGKGCFLEGFAVLRCAPPTAPVPETETETETGPLVDLNTLYDVHDDGKLKQRGINPGVVKAAVDKAGDAVAREPGGVLRIKGIRYVPNPERRRITAAGQLSIRTADMADEYTIDHDGERHWMPAKGVRSVLRRVVAGTYAAVGSAWVETDEQGREVIFAKHIPSELPGQYVPVTVDRSSGSLSRLEPLAGSTKSYELRHAIHTLDGAPGEPFVSYGRTPERLVVVPDKCLTRTCRMSAAQHDEYRAQWAERLEAMGFLDVRPGKCGMSVTWPEPEPTKVVIRHTGPWNEFLYEVEFPEWGSVGGQFENWHTRASSGVKVTASTGTRLDGAGTRVPDRETAARVLAVYWGIPSDRFAIQEFGRGTD
ncbi:hypothetical protein ACFQ7N_39480 [Streptomyces niveus]|uniref:hypothetical protein n=1 Tax=Streptomyces niveus TaxID=193462 RepID=UPI0036B0229A